ncbi:MAG TPA: hypothetical protein VG308_19815 [Stellaceae bacterium]|jgi:hypothetical protein|nr:hypothetical protein [Stellaceae bacterium]
MRRCLSYARCAALGLALLLSPAIVVFIAPIGFGIGADILRTAGPMLCAIVLQAAAALLIGRCLTRQNVLYVAAKSIT